MVKKRKIKSVSPVRKKSTSLVTFVVMFKKSAHEDRFGLLTQNAQKKPIPFNRTAFVRSRKKWAANKLRILRTYLRKKKALIQVDAIGKPTVNGIVGMRAPRSVMKLIEKHPSVELVFEESNDTGSRKPPLLVASPPQDSSSFSLDTRGANIGSGFCNPIRIKHEAEDRQTAIFDLEDRGYSRDEAKQILRDRDS